MKTHKFWKILLGVVAVIVVLGAVGFGFFRYSMWGGRFGAMGKMPYDNWQMQHDADGDMPCEEDGEAVCEGMMSYGGSGGCGMGRMPHMRSMRGGYGMHGGWGRSGHSPFTGLLFLVLVVLGVMHFKRYRHYHNFYHHRSMHMHPGHQSTEDSCCCGEGSTHSDVNTDSDVSQSESEQS